MGAGSTRSARSRASSQVPLAWRIFAVNAVVFAVGVVALMFSPATVSTRVIVEEAAILGAGLAVLLLINLFFVRRALDPLERLMRAMKSTDLLEPGEHLDPSGPAEVSELVAVFDEMLSRLQRERREVGLTLTECRFRADLGITVIAILREPEPVSGALPTDRLQQGDTLVTVGKAGRYAAFRRRLAEGM